MSPAIALTQGNFDEEVLNADVPVLIDFWAPRRGSHRVNAGALDQIVARHPKSLKVRTINVDDQPWLAARAGVRHVPVVVLYLDGRPIAEARGRQSRAALEAILGLDSLARSLAPERAVDRVAA